MLLDISLVTEALIKLIKEGVSVSPAWTSPGTPPNVSPVPPDALAPDSLGLYLYHVAEDGYAKNLPSAGNDQPPVRYTPMGLNLFYQLSARGLDATDGAALQAQRTLGCAIRVLHNFPVIDDGTEVNHVKILQSAKLDGGGNVLRVGLQPLAHEEAVSYWTAGSSPLRLSAYYQVSTVVLEPDATGSRAGRVLSYGVRTVTGGQPRLEGSRNTLSFNVPGESQPRTLELRPAQVPVGQALTFLGSRLAGDRVSLRLKTAAWAAPVEVDTTWEVSAAADQVLATVQPRAGGEDVLPGTYAAAVKVTNRRPRPDGTVVESSFVSNDTPFTITPRIDAVSVAAPGPAATVKGYLFKHRGLGAEAVEVYLDGSGLEQKTVGGPVPPVPALAPGQFVIEDAGHTLHARLPGGFTPGRFLALRVLVNGAESPPHWIQVP